MSVTSPIATDAHRNPPKRNPKSGTNLNTIGDLAREFGVSLRTIRFYEDRGLLAPHRDGSARYYNPDEKAKLRLILKGKQLGFTLGEIRDLMRAEQGGGPPKALPLKADQIALQISHLERQRNDIEGAIHELRETHRRLVSVR